MTAYIFFIIFLLKDKLLVLQATASLERNDLNLAGSFRIEKVICEVSQLLNIIIITRRIEYPHRGKTEPTPSNRMTGWVVQVILGHF